MAEENKKDKEYYDYLKSFDEKELDNDKRKYIKDYESSLYGMPTDEKIEYATTILNEGDQNIVREYKKNGQWAEAEEIIRLSREAGEEMRKKGVSRWVKPVSKTPDDVAKNMKFNWKSAYENVNGETLNPTEADAEKLEKFVQSNLYDLGDKRNLMDVAQNLHMWNPGEQKWSDFISSEQGDRFRDYIEDVRANQEKQAVDKIWSGEEPSPQWTPFGYKDVPGSNFAVSFMTPVAKEYAKAHYKDKDVKTDLLGPLAFDTFTNLAMMGSGKLAQPLEKTLAKELVGNASAPFISAVGNEVYNSDKDDEGLDHLANVMGYTAAGYGANKAAPMAINTAGNFFGRKNAAPTVKSVYTKAKETLDNAVNDARKIANMEKKALVKEADNLYLDNAKNIAYTDDAYEKMIWEQDGFDVKPLKDMPTNKPVFDRSMEGYDNALTRERSGFLGEMKKPSYSKPNHSVYQKPNKNSSNYAVEQAEFENFEKALDKLRSGTATVDDWKNNTQGMAKASEYLGLPTLESRRNWISQHLGIGLDYLANVPGSTPRNQKKFGRTMKALVPDEIYNFDNDDKKKKSEKLIRIYGL